MEESFNFNQSLPIRQLGATVFHKTQDTGHIFETFKVIVHGICSDEVFRAQKADNSILTRNDNRDREGGS